VVISAAPADLSAEDVVIRSLSGSDLRGWLVRGTPGAGAVVVMHGVRGNRSEMVRRMRLLRDAGYGVLAFDFQAHGESPGRRITFGFLESRDAFAAVAFLRERLPGERIGAIGISLGGAAALVGDTPLQVDALVLESVYPDIGSAVADRLAIRVGVLGRVIAPLYVLLMEPVIGVPPARLRPIDRIGEAYGPVLIMSGTEDKHTTIAETRNMFARARKPKELWEVDGAAHVDLLRHAPQAYERRILGFLNRTLRGAR
jgi:fermentation-respiration switch protein FrsA (DUF1100 family)